MSIGSCNIVTISGLVAQDLSQAYILTERPSTFDCSATFVNDKKYLIHDYSPNDRDHNRHQKAMRTCPVAGNSFPILVTHDINPLVREHWCKWLPFFPPPDIRLFDKEDTGEKPLIVNFPIQSFAAKKHAVDPDVHYRLGCKTSIPEMGAPFPRHMTRDHYTLPCMIKAAQGKGKRGTFLVRTEEEAQAAFKELSSHFANAELVITEVIENISNCVIAQMYLNQNGHINCLGLKHKTRPNCKHSTSSDLPPPYINWNEQEALKELVWDVVLPVTKYLHKNGYFGFTGVEILVNNVGKFVIDVNLKISSSTNIFLISPHMAALGYPISYVVNVFPTDLESLIEVINDINSQGEGRAIMLADGNQSGERRHKACVVVFAKNSKKAFMIQEELLKVTGCVQ